MNPLRIRIENIAIDRRIESAVLRYSVKLNIVTARIRSKKEVFDQKRHPRMIGIPTTALNKRYLNNYSPM
jgi:hypothetical protein